MSDGSIVIDTSIDNRGAEKGLKNLSGLAGTALKGVGIAIAGVGTALLGIGAYAISVGTKFEAGMSKVKAISGATADDMTKLADKAKEMGATTKFSATESADALQFMALAGWKTTDMLEGLPGIMNLAAASGEDLGAVSDIVTDSLTAFGMKASESAHFADVLAKASSNSNTNVSMLGESFKYVAPLAGALGYSVEDASIALGLMANSGIKASQAGTSLKTALVNMAKPTSKMKAVMDKYNLSLSNSDGTMKPLAQVTNELRSKMGGLDKATQAAAAATLFGKESLAGMLAVINASPKDYEKLTGAINNADGAAEKMAATMNDNLQGQMTLMGSALEGLGLQIYEKMEGPLKEAAKTAIESIGNIAKSLTDGELSGSVDKLAEGFGNLITKIAEGVETWLPRIITAFTWVMDNSNTIATGIIAIGTALMVLNVANMVMGLVKAFRDAQAILPGLTAAQWLYNTSIMALGGPVIIIIAVIAALVAAVVYLWNTNDDFRAAIISIWDSILDKGKEVWEWLVDFFKVDIPNAFNAVKDFFNNFPTVVSELVINIMKFFNELPGKLGYALGFAIGTLIKWGVNVLSWIATTVPKMIGNIIKFYLSLPGKIATVFVDVLNKIIEWGTNIASWAANTLPGIVTDIVGFFLDLPGDMIDIGVNVVKGLWNGMKSMISWLGSKVSDFAGGIVSGMKGALGIHSPSKVVGDEVGKFIPSGIGLGIDKAMPNLQKDIQDNMSDLTAKMRATVDFETAKTTAKVVSKHEYVSNENDQSNVNKSDKKSINPTIIAKLIVDGKEFTQTVVAPNQEVLNDFYKGR
jgi:TP901 family phage tail tape measure protein